MDITTFLIHVFCLIDDFMQGRRLRQRGPQPTLSDSEVLTMELVGSLIGIDTDKGLYTHFKRHYGDWFPALRRIHRTTFTRQAANLWWLKERLWRHVLRHLHYDRHISLVDSFPVPICRFARARRCRRLREAASFGWDEVAKQTFLGLRVHLRVCWPGVIVDFRLAPANHSELRLAEEMLAGLQGWALGDRNYWSPRLQEQLQRHGLQLLAPVRHASKETQPWPRWLSFMRYRIETVIGQLVERFHARRVWARDAWHLYSRWLRRILSHTLAVFFCQRQHLPTLSFAKLIAD